MAKDFYVVRVFGEPKIEIYGGLGERVKETGKVIKNLVHVYPFDSGFVEEHPGVLIGILQSSDTFLCPSSSVAEIARLVCGGDYSVARELHRALFREYNLGNPEKRSVSLARNR